MIRVAPRLPDLSEAFPSAVLDLDARRRVGKLAKYDLDICGICGVGGDVPEIAQAAWRIPFDDFAPFDLAATGRALEDPSATPGSKTISDPASCDTVCSTGHHDEALRVHVANAWSGAHATTNDILSGSIIAEF